MQDNTNTRDGVNESNALNRLTAEEQAQAARTLREIAAGLKKVSQEISEVRSEMSNGSTIDLRKQPEISYAQVVEEQERLGPIMRWQIASAFQMLNEFRLLIEDSQDTIQKAIPYIAAARRLELDTSFQDAMGFETLRTVLLAFLPIAGSFHDIEIGTKYAIDEETAAFRSDIAHGRIGMLVSEGFGGTELGEHLEAIGPIMRYAKPGQS